MVTWERVYELMQSEKTCIVRNRYGKCSRKCADCDLVQDNSDLIEAYDKVLSLLSTLEFLREKRGK